MTCIVDNFIDYWIHQQSFSNILPPYLWILLSTYDMPQSLKLALALID